MRRLFHPFKRFFLKLKLAQKISLLVIFIVLLATSVCAAVSGRWYIARMLENLEQNALKLLHAKTGAAIARDVFAVDDAVYRAIYWHTTGHADMTLLEKIIYLADYIEPSRDFPGVDDLRQAVHADLDRGLLKALDDSIQDMRQWGNPVHHNTLDARDYLLRGKHL